MDCNDQTTSKSLIFSKNQKGNETVLYGLHRYNNNGNKNKDGSSLWRCVNREGCSASITINRQRTTVLRESTHLCEPSTSNNVIHLAKQDFKRKVCSRYSPVRQLYEESFNGLDTEDDDSDFNLSDVPTFNSIKRSMYRARRNVLNVKSTQFDNLEDVLLPDILKEKFLICEDGHTDKILMFGTTLSLKTIKIIADKTVFFGDGTFEVVPKPFFQLYSIHMDVESTDEYTCVIPMIYALLPDKTTDTYFRLFSILRDKFNIVIRRFKCDYEKAQVNAMKAVFPACEISGCYFHFQRAIFRNAKKYNLSNYEERKLALFTSHLPLLPKNLIPEGWNAIVNMIEETNADIINFENYFEKEWLSPSLKVDISCCNDRHRTNNSVEAWHSRIKKRMNETKNNLFKFIDLLRKEAKTQDCKIKRSLFDRNRRKRNVILYDKRYKEKLQEVIEGDIMPLDFLKICIRLRKQCSV